MRRSHGEAAENRVEALEEQQIRPGTSGYQRARALYLAAFPMEERFPFPMLWLVSLKKAVRLTGYYEAGQFLGFTHTVDTGRYLYLSFFAVDPSLRSRGLGGQILERLRAQYPGRDMVVEVEPPEEAAENAGQRQRRMDFYLRNGFHDLNRHITGGGVRYTILSTGTDLDRNEYFRIFKLLNIRFLAAGARIGRRLWRG